MYSMEETVNTTTYTHKSISSPLFYDETMQEEHLNGLSNSNGNENKNENAVTLPPCSYLFDLVEPKLSHSLQNEFKTDSELTSTFSDDEESEDEEEEDDDEEKTFSPSENFNGKKKRIEKRCLEVLDHFELCEEAKSKVRKLIDGINEVKLKKKSHRSLAASISVIILKNYGNPVDIKKLSKIIPRTDRHHKAKMPTKAAESSDAVCISRLATSLEKKPIADHYQTTIESTKVLCEKLKLNQQQTLAACKLAELSEDPSLASRHAQSIAAACVAVATNSSVNSIVKASSISATTIRKTITVLKKLTNSN